MYLPCEARPIACQLYAGAAAGGREAGRRAGSQGGREREGGKQAGRREISTYHSACGSSASAVEALYRSKTSILSFPVLPLVIISWPACEASRMLIASSFFLLGLLCALSA